jgi:Pyruvate/2-oxoacid:ferredoxin oxidoreductase gamma subunit
MLGAAMKFLPLKEENLIAAIRQKVKKKFIEMNLDAFNRGFSLF